MRLRIPQFILRRITTALIKKAVETPYFDLYHGKSLYMSRWWLRIPPGHNPHRSSYDKSKSGIGIRLHRTYRSDSERDLHDHPWWNISIVLRGGYWEVMPHRQTDDPHCDSFDPKRVWRGEGSIVFRRATDRHRLEIDPNIGPALSLFIMGPWQRHWGFHTPTGWSFWRDYLGIPYGQDEDRNNGSEQ